MNYIQKLKNITRKQRSHVIVGLDPDINLIPFCFFRYSNPISAFNKAVIEATKSYAAGYKMNLAFYESAGVKGMQALQDTVEYIPEELIRICDAKRSDIENTSEMYARAYLDNLPFDSITVNPYMGYDSIKPYIKRKNKFVYLIILTSNTGSKDFQMLKTGNKYLYDVIAQKCLNWGKGKTGFVIGANHLQEIEFYSAKPHNAALLIPGIGAQKNDLMKTLMRLKNDRFLINASRSIIFSADRSSSRVSFKKRVKESVILLKNKISDNLY